MKRQLTALLAAFGLVAGALAFCADVPVTPQPFSTTAASGTLGPWPCIGATSATITINSGGSSTLTVKGSADAVVPGTYVTNTNFGTAGVITSPGTNTTWNGNVAAFPQGFEITFTGNTGTLSGTVTCTGANGQTVIGSVSLVTPVPVTQSSVPWSISCLAAYPCGFPTPSPQATNPVTVYQGVNPLVVSSPFITASPNGGAAEGLQPNAACANNAGTTNCAAVNSSQQLAVAPATPFGPSPCPGASISAAVCASPAPYATVPSPAPGNLLGHGYNSAGVAAPIICHNYATVQIAATTQSTETVVVPSAAGKVVYICSVVMSGLGTATSAYGLSTSATNTCGTMTNLLTSNPGASTQAAPVSLGSGVGVVAQTPAGVALCFFNATTSPAGTAQVNIMYEQFLRSLTPEQLDEFCSIPKRCALYGLVKHLDRLLNRVENPIP